MYRTGERTLQRQIIEEFSKDHLYENLIRHCSLYEDGLNISWGDYMVELDQIWYIFFNIVSPGVHTLLPSVLQCLESRCIEVLILPSQVFLFFHVEEQKMVRWCQIRSIWRVINQKPQSRTAAIATTDLCAGALSW